MLSENYHVDWYDETKHTILITVTGHWTWEEAYAGVEKAAQMANTTDHTVSVIYYYTNFSASQLPRGTRVFANLKGVMQSVTANQTMIIMVNATTLMQGFMSILTQAYNMHDIFQKYHFVNTLDEALRAIQDSHAYLA